MDSVTESDWFPSKSSSSSLSSNPSSHSSLMLFQDWMKYCPWRHHTFFLLESSQNYQSKGGPPMFAITGPTSRAPWPWHGLVWTTANVPLRWPAHHFPLKDKKRLSSGWRPYLRQYLDKSCRVQVLTKLNVTWLQQSYENWYLVIPWNSKFNSKSWKYL